MMRSTRMTSLQQCCHLTDADLAKSHAFKPLNSQAFWKEITEGPRSVNVTLRLSIILDYSRAFWFFYSNALETLLQVLARL